MIIVANFCYSILLSLKYIQNDVNFLTHILTLFALIPMLVSLYSLFAFHAHLVEEHNDSKAKRFLKGGGILAAGIIIGLASQLIIFGTLTWIENKIN